MQYNPMSLLHMLYKYQFPDLLQSGLFGRVMYSKNTNMVVSHYGDKPYLFRYESDDWQVLLTLLK